MPVMAKQQQQQRSRRNAAVTVSAERQQEKDGALPPNVCSINPPSIPG